MILGRLEDPKDKTVKHIAAALKQSFETFKYEKEAPTVLTLHERGWEEGMAEGKEIGLAKGQALGQAEGKSTVAAEALKLIEQGIDPSDVLREILAKNIPPVQ